MASKFAQDVFVSFASTDDAPESHGRASWVHAFQQTLAARLEGILGRNVRVSNSSHGSSDELLQRTAALVAVLSPSYAASERPRRELAEFARLVGPSERSARIFKVVQAPVVRAEQPEELQGLRAYDFLIEDPDRGALRELEPMAGRESDSVYWLKLDDLARDIAAFLQPDRIASDDSTAEPGAAAYIARCDPALRSEREAIVRELTRHGYRVLPDAPLPSSAAELEAAVKHQLEDCRLFIQLIGRDHAHTQKASEPASAGFESRLAGARRASDPGLEILYWAPREASESAAWSENLLHLVSDPAHADRAELVRTSLPQFQALVLERLRGPRPVNQDALRKLKTSRTVYLICDHRDQALSREIAHALHSRGLDVRQPHFEGNETEVRTEHEAHLGRHAALIVHRSGSSEWLRRMVRDLKKSEAYDRGEPLRAHAVLAMTPEPPKERHLGDSATPVIHHPREFEPEILDEFVQATGRPRNEGGARLSNPFPGARSFDLDDDLFFFGRERATDEVLARLRAARFVAVTGETGSGKSSLLRAGLVSALHGGLMPGAGSSWRILDLRSADKALGDLAAGIQSEIFDRARADADDRAAVEAILRGSSRGLLDCLLEARLPATVNTLVLMDPNDARAVWTDPVVSRLLIHAAEQDERPIYVAAALDPETLGRVATSPDLARAMNNGIYVLPSMRRDEYRSAIVGPISVAGGSIAPRLVTRLLNEFCDQPAPLSELQAALRRAWDQWSEDHDENEPIDLRHHRPE